MALTYTKIAFFVCMLNEEGIIFQEKYGVLTTELSKMASALEMYGVEENYFIAFFDRPNGAVCYRVVAWHLIRLLFDPSRCLGLGIYRGKIVISRLCRNYCFVSSTTCFFRVRKA